MYKIIITSLLTIILIIGSFCVMLWYRYKNITAVPPDKIKILSTQLTGAGKLIVAEEIVYHEYIKKFERGPAYARVLFRWVMKLQYLIDMQNPRFKVTFEGNNLKVYSPAIIMNEPIIDITKYKPAIVIDGSIWIDEQKLINDEMRHFKFLSQVGGKDLLNQPHVLKLCTDQIELAVLKIAAGLNIQADSVEVVFCEE